MTKTAAELATLLSGKLEGPDTSLSGVQALEQAGPSDLSFAANRKAAETAAKSNAGCLLVPLQWPEPAGRTVIRVDDPRAAFAKLIRVLKPEHKPARGVHFTAVVDPTARLAEDVIVGAGCVLGRDVEIGSGSRMHANVTIYDGVRIGARAVIHSGAVIGADGFGFAMTSGRWEKFPQVGVVVIGDDVEIGANSCIDRAALGETVIGDGTKLDNMVHIGHNCRIGKHVVIAAQTGLSGGVTVGDYAVIGGQVGVGDKARIESKAVIGSGSGILTSKIVRAGEPVWGTPARALKDYLEVLAMMNRLPEMRAQLKQALAKIDELEKR